jgi:hypothetical protein
MFSKALVLLQTLDGIDDYEEGYIDGGSDVCCDRSELGCCDGKRMGKRLGEVLGKQLGLKLGSSDGIQDRTTDGG